MKVSKTSAACGMVLVAAIAVAAGAAAPADRAQPPAAGVAAPPANPTSRPPPTPAPTTPAAVPPDPIVERGTVRILRLPEADPNLPPGPGLETVTTYCAMCHTPAYITLQPPLSRETWTAEIQKMRTTFSGPIPEEKVGEILEYLMAVRGAPSAAK